MSTRVRRTIRIVDNGGKPFIVKLTSSKGPGVAHVWRMKDGRYGSELRELWRSFEYQRVFIGKDPSETARPAPEKAWWHGGNTLLLKTGNKEYVCIMSEIFSFRTSEDIEEYVSPMGGSATPYPFAVGKEKTYLLVEKTYIFNRVLSRPPKDPYEVFYKTNLRTGESSGTQGPGSVAARKARAEYVATHRLNRFRLLHPRI